MLAYHNDEKLKKSTVAEMAKHRKADSLLQSYGYWQDGRGCAVGCLIKGDDHTQYETRFGIPSQLARLEDSIFEGLPTKDAKKWPERFLKAIRPGADLTRVWSAFAWWMLTDKEYGEIVYAGDNQMVKDAIMGVAKLHKEVVDGKRSAAESAAWSAARSAAWSAAGPTARPTARSAARSAAESDAGLAAGSAAWSAAESAARSAARSAAGPTAGPTAWSAARSAAKSAAYKRMADKLIELLEAA